APITDAPAPAAPPSPSPVDPFEVEAARKQALRSCRRAAAKRATKIARLRGGKLCLRRYARTPGRVMRVTARATSATALVLGFSAPGSDGRTAPAARRYLIKQSLRPIRTPTEFRRAHSLCRGSCAFPVTEVGTKISLAVTQLRRHSSYYYAVAARDNVSNRLGPRSFSATGRTR
ncbi:MAG: hypothetical protein QOG42_1201, partial [Solirubrobacteraceae bacterium]|nr:hypothetical protein [Solirubrobacteraceae bacterium]